MNARPSTAPAPALTLLRLACFASLGGLAGRQVGSDAETVLVGAVAAVLIGESGLLLLGAALYLVNPEIRAGHGYGGIRAALARGFLMLLPFAALALVAELLLGWDASQAFIAAALTTSAATGAGEIATLGGRALPSALLATLVAAALTGISVLLAATSAVGG